jgi:hypothetical protein
MAQPPIAHPTSWYWRQRYPCAERPQSAGSHPSGTDLEHEGDDNGEHGRDRRRQRDRRPNNTTSNDEARRGRRRSGTLAPVVSLDSRRRSLSSPPAEPTA